MYKYELFFIYSYCIFNVNMDRRMINDPFRQHSRIENSPSPTLYFAGSSNTSSQFYNLPRRTDNYCIRSSGITSDTVPYKTSND